MAPAKLSSAEYCKENYYWRKEIELQPLWKYPLLCRFRKQSRIEPACYAPWSICKLKEKWNQRHINLLIVQIRVHKQNNGHYWNHDNFKYLIFVFGILENWNDYKRHYWKHCNQIWVVSFQDFYFHLEGQFSNRKLSNSSRETESDNWLEGIVITKFVGSYQVE